MPELEQLPVGLKLSRQRGENLLVRDAEHQVRAPLQSFSRNITSMFARRPLPL